MNKESIKKYIITRDIFARKYLVPCLTADGQILELQYLLFKYSDVDSIQIWRLDRRSVPSYLRGSIEDNFDGMDEE